MNTEEKENPTNKSFLLTTDSLAQIVHKRDDWRFVREEENIFICQKDQGNHKAICDEMRLENPIDGGYLKTSGTGKLRIMPDVSNGLDLNFDVSERTQLRNRPHTTELFKKIGEGVEGFGLIE